MVSSYYKEASACHKGKTALNHLRLSKSVSSAMCNFKSCKHQGEDLDLKQVAETTNVAIPKGIARPSMMAEPILPAKSEIAGPKLVVEQDVFAEPNLFVRPRLSRCHNGSLDQQESRHQKESGEEGAGGNNQSRRTEIIHKIVDHLRSWNQITCEHHQDEIGILVVGMKKIVSPSMIVRPQHNGPVR